MTSCANCGAEATADDRFCRDCGKSLDATSTDGSHSAAGAGATPPPDARATATLLRTAQRAHKRGRFDEAREAYTAVILAGHPRLAARAARGLKLAEKDRRPTGRLGFWAVGFMLAAAALTWLITFLPARVESALALPVMSILSFGIFAGGALGLIALLGQRGGMNRLAGFAASGGVVWALVAGGQMDTEKEQRYLVQNGMMAAMPARMAVQEVHQQSGRFPDATSAAPLGELSREHAELIDAVTIGAGGVITVQFAAGFNGPISGKTLILRPAAGADGYTWDCHEGTVPLELRASNCRSAGG